MKRENKRTLALFIILILLFILLFIYNDYSNRPIIVNNRKVTTYFATYSYNDVINYGNQLLLDAVNIIDVNNLEYEKNHTNGIVYYSLHDYNRYKKITNFNIISRTLNSNDLKQYMIDNKITVLENTYFIQNSDEKITTNYIGSSLKFDYYDQENIWFKSTNYYCDNKQYIGIIKEEPKCEFTKEVSRFNLIYEDGTLKIGNLEDIKKILK